MEIRRTHPPSTIPLQVTAISIKIEIYDKTYLDASRHGEDIERPLFRPVKHNTTGELRKLLHPKSVYNKAVQRYGKTVGITVDVHGFCVHSWRATAATNPLAHHADIAEVQEWLGHAHVSTTRMYEKRRSRLEESATFTV